jgi:response regulator RpfG family c-di-GMP phosphodiesterase
MKHRIMLVDDEPGILNALRRMLQSKAATELAGLSLELETFESPVKALERAGEVPFALVLSDYRMPEMSGVAFLARIKSLQPCAMRLILSGYADLTSLIAAINEARIHCFLSKPWVDGELREAIRQAIVAHEELCEQEKFADLTRERQGTMTSGEVGLKLLAQTNPALARVNWALDGGVMLDPEDG